MCIVAGTADCAVLVYSKGKKNLTDQAFETFYWSEVTSSNSVTYAAGITRTYQNISGKEHTPLLSHVSLSCVVFLENKILS